MLKYTNFWTVITKKDKLMGENMTYDGTRLQTFWNVRLNDITDFITVCLVHEFALYFGV